MNKIGKQLKVYRLKHDLSLEEAAFMLDIPVEAYAAIENDVAEISLKQLLKLCKYYGIKPDAFLNLEAAEDSKAAIAEPWVESESETVEEATGNGKEEAADDGETDYPSIYELDRSKRKVKAKEVIAALKKEGKEVTEEEAEKVLDFMYMLAPIAVSQAMREARWQQRLERSPKGFPVKSGKFPCRLCGHGGGDYPMWYDRFGLKCRACQNAVEKGVVPGEITGDDTLYYSEHDFGHYFRLNGNVLKEWIKKGLLKPRIISGADGKGKHYQVFLTSDHEGFLPPITMFRIGGLVEEEENGKKYIRGTKWYEHVEPFEYLKDYGIIKYMKLKEPDNNDKKLIKK
jgi:transcriptional regulator with XRE-family HTH domain